MKPSEVTTIVAMLAAAYPAARMNEATVDVYELMLGDLDYQVARDAIARIIRTSKFLPTVAEILEAAATEAVGETRNALQAWGDVMQAIRRVGQYGLPKFKDPLVAECVKSLGWRYLCTADVPESVDRARFAELYNDLQRRERVATITAPGRLLPPKTEQAPELPGNVRELVRKVGR